MLQEKSGRVKIGNLQIIGNFEKNQLNDVIRGQIARDLEVMGEKVEVVRIECFF